jgi:hypothetical protein
MFNSLGVDFRLGLTAFHRGLYRDGPGTHLSRSYTGTAELTRSYIRKQSLAMPLYFAARRQGHWQGHGPYSSQAKVLLSGLGADESVLVK